MQFRIWCRWGELPLGSTDEKSAIEEAVSYALRNCLFVVLMDEDRDEIAHIPPALQTDAVVAILFGSSPPGTETVALN